MKIRYFFLAVFAVFSALVYGQAVPEMMYYRFNVPNASSVQNEASAPVGTNPSSIAGTGMSVGSTGQFGSALVGAGTSSTSDYLNTGWATSLSGDWTISFYTSNITSSSTLYYIFGDNNASSFRCFTNGVAGSNNWMLRGTGISDVLITGGATAAPHVSTFVYDSSVPEIKAYLDGSLQTTVSQSAISLSGSGPFKVGAYSGSTNLSGRMDEFRMYSHALTAAEVAAVWNQTLPLIVNEYPYCQNFDNSPGNWAEGGTQISWEHGEPNNSIISAANSPDNAWVTNLDGNYNNDELSYVSSPEFDLSPLVDPMIGFYAIRNLQSGTDGVQFQISTDSGATYSALGSSSSSNWYNSNSVSALNAAVQNPNGWTGTQTSWTYMQHSLASFASDTSVLFRFLLASNGSNVSEGFGFDDIIVAESNDLKLVSLIYSDTICGNSATTIRGLVCNNSVIDQNGFTVDIDTNGNVVSATISDTLQVCGCDTFDLFTFNSSDGGTWNFTAELNNSGDVNAANDTASGVIFAYPSPKVYASGGGTKCEGETDTLTFTFVGTSPWNLSYTDGTSTQYNGNVTNPFTVVVTQSGNYQATGLSDASGCPADTSNMFGIASYTFVPSPQIDLGNDTTVCGDYILDAGSGYSAYDWSTGATGQSITASNSGNYSVTVLSSLGCEGSGSINLTILDVPIIDIHDDVICEGTTYLFNAGGGSASYVWHDGSTGQVYQVSGVGQVSVTVTGFNGCVSSATAFITAVVSNPTPTVTSTASIAPVTLNAGSGYIDYNWNTGDTSQTITVYAVGTYTCTVTDDNGCIGSDDVKTKIWPSSVEELTVDRGFSVFPNPADDWVTIQFTESQVPAFAEIIDLKGVLVKKAPLAQHGRAQLLNVSKLPVGVYIIRCSIDDSISQQTFNVTR